jgi:hypothetical protein
MSMIRDWKKEPFGSTAKDYIVGGIVLVALIRLVLDLIQAEFRWEIHQIVLVCVLVAAVVAIWLLRIKK